MYKRFRKLSTTLICALSLTSVSQANVVGADTQNFNPTTNGLDFVTVHSSETLSPGIVNLGFFFNFATNSLPNLENTQTQTFSDVKDTLTSMDLNMGLGLTRNWDVGISLPRVLKQTINENTATYGRYAATGMTEIRANTKFRFFGDSSHGLATILSMNLPLIENNPFTGEKPGPTYNIELAADTTVDKVALGFNVGYRIRQPGTIIPSYTMEPLKNQYIASAAASYLVQDWDTKFIAELFGSAPAEKTQFQSDRDLSSLELLLGLKWDVTSQLATHAGTGFGLIHGAASPDFRAFAGLNYAFGPLWGHSSEDEVIARIEARPEGKERPAAPQETITPSYFVIDDNLEVFDRTPTAPVETFVAREILFAFDSSEIRQEFYPVLAKLANYLMKGKGFKKLIIEGHTDSVGSDSYNLGLSQRRAAAVRKLLLKVTKLPAEKVEATGFGERRPIADNGNYQGRQLNRRVEFKIYRDL